MEKTSDYFAPNLYTPIEQLCNIIDNAIIRVVRIRGWEFSADDIYATVYPIAYGIASLHNIVQQRVDTVFKYRTQLDHLISLPKIEQRTQEWYDMRKTMTTASDLAQALGLGKFGSQKDFIVKKCGYKEDAPFQWMLPPLRWGVKYEPVAAEVYRYKHGGVQLHEFGLIQHPVKTYFGASPDGITDLGVMLEIKCPYRRKINGDIPMQYYYQIQGQLDVCGLEECDYMEIEFKEYSNRDFFAADTHVLDSTRTHDFKEKGVLLEYKVKGQDIPEFRYGPLCQPLEDVDKWVDMEEETLHSDETVEWVNKVYWRVQEFLVKRVYRDPEFIRQAYAGLDGVWQRITAYKNDKTLYDKDILDSPSAQASELQLQPPTKRRGRVATNALSMSTPKLNKSTGLEEECMIKL
jgi:putative phage-type endonuclease